MSAPDLAERLGVTRQTIYRWERGEDIPHPDRQAEVAEILGVPWAELFSPLEVAS
jgi:transcriptional regulator with XRE-family HTH domain